MGVNVEVFPKKGADIESRRIASHHEPFSILQIGPEVEVYVTDRPTLDALQAALDAIRADMDAAESVPA